MTHHDLTAELVASRLRAMRRHPKSPTKAEVGHWRRGTRVPTHDMRVFIEILTGGEVTINGWAPRTKKARGKSIAAQSVA